MPRSSSILPSSLLALLMTFGAAAGQTEQTETRDLSRQNTLYVVGYSHLDTQWRWEYPQVISEFIPNTMRQNFELFEKYPNYVFNFSGANRYRMMKEYHPDDYRRVKEYVAAGRWFPSGSAMEESDVNVPSAESLIRQILYGSQFFRRELGVTSAEYMLPDCFGFPASLPSILSHAGIKGFSTQKLTWKSAAGLPFNVGVWEGLNGESVIAALNPGSYNHRVPEDLSHSEEWIERVRENGRRSGVFTDYHYYGVGDRGGAPRDSSVMWVERSVTGDGPLEIVSATAEQMFLDITPEQEAGLPRYRGDLLLIEHSAGSITSQAYMKRWNRHGELLADAAERASVTAEWLGARSYPMKRLNDAWTLIMGGQFHDILPGTSTPKAYEYSWNDAVLAMNQLAGVLTDAVEAVGAGMDTQVEGTPIIVYNPLSIDREDVVQATLSFPERAPASVSVVGPDGREVPSQILSVSRAGPGADTEVEILFIAALPPVGFVVYDVRAENGEAPGPRTAPGAASALGPSASSELRVTESSLENARYRIELDANGNVASLYDKTLDRELLSAPARLALQHHRPLEWPAWNMDWDDQRVPPRAYVEGPAQIRITERGPVRVALEVVRETEESSFVQTIRLSAGDAGDRVEVGNVIDWRTAETALKATFPLTASNPRATYNWEVGTLMRGNNDSTKYEVPSHQWFDLTDTSGEYGVTVLSDAKYGSDKPDDSTLRLTLVYSPGITRSYGDQATQDWGHHEFVYGLAGHAGDWRQERTDWQALRLNQPLIAFESPRHDGELGRTLSLLRVSSDRVRVLAVKKAEESDEVIVRLVELDGKPTQNVRVAFAASVLSAREVNGQEQPVGEADVTAGELVVDLDPYQLRTFAVTLEEAPAPVANPRQWPVRLPFDRMVSTRDGETGVAGFDAQGRSLPAEMLPTEIAYNGIRFSLAPGGAGRPNAMVAQSQRIPLPDEEFTRVYILAASADGDQRVRIRLDDSPVDLTIQDWGGYIGQWDNRIWNRRVIPATTPTDTTQAARRRARARTEMEYLGLTPGFIKGSPVAWFASHHHTAEGANEPYAYAYLFAYSVDVPVGTRTLTLPGNDRIRILAVTVSDEGAPVMPAHPLYDTLVRTENR